MAPDCLSLQIVNDTPALRSTDVRVAPGRSRAWLYRFVDDARMQEALLSLLSEDELVRARAFIAPAARQHYIQTRAVLRMLLGRVLETSPKGLAFDYGPYGKPSLRDADACCFNIAHSGDYALLAVSQGLPVGVDIERQREIEDLDALARMVLSPAEAGGWAALPPVDRVPTFFSIWTAKEALVKATGRGLGLSLTSLEVGSLTGDILEAGCRVQVGESGVCRLLSLDAPLGYTAALAVQESL
ncbi:4'-phosphopantetheinyl transferase superfamily protein [Pusillimonas sp. T7-7]|uniref:4'-phosphopantetheinyl transferase family protein n=1 Tax=Pusillimonas sp. (strain T7-7) TaxID=1007105 RepID=UPI0002EE18F8|nr:4'-phosphopantetheinyl transferase superfamily protein [Pusillimonas sp. T7-7]